MAKEKSKKVLEPVIEQVDGGETVVRVVKREYIMVPFDAETHDGFMKLVAYHGLGRRGQGAMARILVRNALAALPKTP